MSYFEWLKIHSYILELEQQGLVTRTFRRLDPDRQQVILDAILEEAVAKGPTAVNIKHIAERANVAVGSLYLYFGSRDGLLKFAVAVCMRLLQDTFESIRPYIADTPLRASLTMYIQGGVEMTKTHMGLLQFFARAAYHGESELSESVVRPIAVLMRSLVQEMLAAAIQRGEVRADIDLEAAARVVHMLTIAYGDSLLFPYLNIYFQVTDEQVTAERTMEALINLIFNGIGTKDKPTDENT